MVYQIKMKLWTMSIIINLPMLLKEHFLELNNHELYMKNILSCHRTFILCSHLSLQLPFAGMNGQLRDAGLVGVGPQRTSHTSNTMGCEFQIKCISWYRFHESPNIKKQSHLNCSKNVTTLCKTYQPDEISQFLSRPTTVTLYARRPCAVQLDTGSRTFCSQKKKKLLHLPFNPNTPLSCESSKRQALSNRY